VKIGFFLRESLRAMRRNAAPSFAALATVLVTMLVLGVFIPIVQATNGAANSVRSRVMVDVYLKTSSTSADVARVQKELLATAHVKSVQFPTGDSRSMSRFRACRTRKPTRGRSSR
jgi:cell division transport system permease protein